MWQMLLSIFSSSWTCCRDLFAGPHSRTQPFVSFSIWARKPFQDMACASVRMSWGYQTFWFLLCAAKFKNQWLGYFKQMSWLIPVFQNQNILLCSGSLNPRCIYFILWSTCVLLRSQAYLSLLAHLVWLAGCCYCRRPVQGHRIFWWSLITIYIMTEEGKLTAIRKHCLCVLLTSHVNRNCFWPSFLIGMEKNASIRIVAAYYVPESILIYFFIYTQFGPAVSTKATIW